MNSNHSVVNRAIIGGAIGGSIVTLIVPLFFEFRFIGSALAVLGTCGAIGGALFGAVLGKFSNTIGLAFGGIIGGLGGCILAGCGIAIYPNVPWPSPQPYPSVQIQTELGSVGSWGTARSQTYMAAHSIDTVRQYYEDQTQQYCINAWDFHPSPDTACRGCLEAECQIRRLGLEQYFRVRLRPVSENQVEVVHVDIWED